jgi:outer membrane protein TolC
MSKLSGFLLLYLLIAGALAESQPVTLPDPLDLGYALSLAKNKAHYDVLEGRALEELARSEVDRADSNLALQIDLELEAAIIKPSPQSPNQDNDDHRAILRVTKPLYDFGRTENKRQAAQTELVATKGVMKSIYDRRRLEIARHFFAVILADLQYAWDTEKTVIAYVHNDAVKDRHTLGEISDVELLEANHEHQLLFQKRAVTESQQRITRAMLAEVLNLPGELSSNLKTPHLEYHKKNLPEYSVLLDEMMRNNAQIKLQQAQVSAAQKRMQAARYQTRPSLSAELEVAEYSRDYLSNNDVRASLNLSIPLLEHTGVKADVSRHRSQWLKQRAMLLKTQSQLRQRLYEIWQSIHSLKLKRLQLVHSMDYRELKLDRSRALYELEVKTDLGDAMVGISEVRFKQAKADFELALIWMELQMLLNNDVLDGERF